jgi:hypothetical protein
LLCAENKSARGQTLTIPEALVDQCNSILASPHPDPHEAATCKSILKLVAQTPLPHGTPGPGSLPVQQRLFVRADRIDNLFYGVIPGYSSGQAQGASIGYTDNRDARSATGAISPSNTLTLAGTVSYVLSPTPWNFDVERFSTLAAAIWIYGNGQWDYPIKPFSDASVVKTGLDLQYAQKYPSGVLDDLLFDVAPYYETNFEGDANAFGTSFTMEPVVSSIYLGQSSGGNALFNGFWIFRPEADVVHIANLPYTNLSSGTYDWMGATLRAYVFLFPSTNFPWPPALADRFSLIGTAEYFRDAHTGMEARYYVTQLQYSLNGCTTKDKSVASCPQGTASVSFEYDYGADRDTMINANKYLVKFSYKY